MTLNNNVQILLIGCNCQYRSGLYPVLADDLGTLFANNEPNKDPSVHIHQPVYVHQNKERGTVEMERFAGRRAP